jgi:hypothetical protein
MGGDEIEKRERARFRARESERLIHRFGYGEASGLVAHREIAMSAVPAMTPSKMFFA